MTWEVKKTLNKVSFLVRSHAHFFSKYSHVVLFIHTIFLKSFEMIKGPMGCKKRKYTLIIERIDIYNNKRFKKEERSLKN